MDLAFEPVSLARQQEYRRHLHHCPQKASDYSFVNIWGWAEEYGLQWAWQPPLVWIRQTIPQTIYWAPVGDWSNTDWEMALRYFSNAAPRFCRLPEQLAEIWKAVTPTAFQMASDRDNWDYLYSVKALSELKGKPFHKKKNLLNQFQKNYQFQYQTMGQDTIAAALAMQSYWCTWRDCESSDVLSAENRVIEKILKHWNEIEGITGGAIYVDRQIVAYTVAEDLGDETLLIHFEKGDPEFKGVYQAINQMFLTSVKKRFTVVNREQDLGNEGLRKAKLSYHPVDFVRKYKLGGAVI